MALADDLQFRVLEDLGYAQLLHWPGSFYVGFEVVQWDFWEIFQMPVVWDKIWVFRDGGEVCQGGA